jgi:hypothetical protein
MPFTPVSGCTVPPKPAQSAGITTIRLAIRMASPSLQVGTPPGSSISPLRCSGWTAPLRVRRITPGENTTAVAVEQIRSWLSKGSPAPSLPIFTFDARYDPVHLSLALGALPVGRLVCLRVVRWFYADPTFQLPTGRPRRQCLIHTERPSAARYRHFYHLPVVASTNYSGVVRLPPEPPMPPSRSSLPVHESRRRRKPEQSIPGGQCGER